MQNRGDNNGEHWLYRRGQHGRTHDAQSCAGWTRGQSFDLSDEAMNFAVQSVPHERPQRLTQPRT